MVGFATEPITLRETAISSGLNRMTDVTGAANNVGNTAHGTGGNVIQRVRAGLAGGTTVAALPAWNAAAVDAGWRIDPADLGTSDSRVGVSIPSGSWTILLRLQSSVAQATAQTIVSVRVFKRAADGTTTELFRKTRNAIALGAGAVNVDVVCDNTSIIGAGGATGTPPAVTLGLNETIQMEVYVESPGVAVVGQTITQRLNDAAGISRADLPGLTSVVTEPAATNTAVAVHTASAALADSGRNTATTALSAAAEALAEIQRNTATAAHTGAESLAEIARNTATALHTAALEALVDAGRNTAVALPTAAVEALAEIGGHTSQALVAAVAEALAEIGSGSSLALHSGPWRLLSPGLSGVVYDAFGAGRQAAAEVLVFRDDTDEKVATLTADGAGEWAVDLDPAFTYWIAGWDAESPNVFGRTDKGIVPVETEIASGTSGP